MHDKRGGGEESLKSTLWHLVADCRISRKVTTSSFALSGFLLCTLRTPISEFQTLWASVFLSEIANCLNVEICSMVRESISNGFTWSWQTFFSAVTICHSRLVSSRNCFYFDLFHGDGFCLTPSAFFSIDLFKGFSRKLLIWGHWKIGFSYPSSSY